MKISKNFSLNEFTKSETAQRLNINNSLPHNGEDLKIKALVVYLLQPWRDRVGRMTINSGYRCPALNAAVGGVAKSRHWTWNAADDGFNVSQLSAGWHYL